MPVLFIALSTSNLAFTYTGLSVVAFKWWVALAAISGVSIVLGLWTHVLLEIKLLGRTIIIAGFTCSFLGILCMAPIRGRAFALQMNSAISGSTSNEQGAAFYTSSLTLFFIFFGLLSLAMELGAGYTLHQWMKLQAIVDPALLQKERDQLQHLVADLRGEIALLDVEPEAREARYRAEHTRGLAMPMRLCIRKPLLADMPGLSFNTTICPDAASAVAAHSTRIPPGHRQ